LGELQNNYDEIQKYNAIILAVDIKEPEEAIGLIEAYSLEYPLLCDVKIQTVKTYKAFDDEKNDIIPAVYILNKKGIIKWKYIGKDEEDVVDSKTIIEELKKIEAGM